MFISYYILNIKSSGDLLTKMNDFIRENKSEIINLYKGTLVAFQIIPEDGYKNLIEICRTEQNTLIINFKPDDDDDIIIGCTIAVFDEKHNKFIKCSREQTLDLNREEYKKMINAFYEFKEDNESERLKPSNSEIGHVCDGKNNCLNDITYGSLICETCDFDLCAECRKNYQHEHQMFEYNGYYGWNTFEKTDVIDKETIKITE